MCYLHPPYVAAGTGAWGLATWFEVLIKIDWSRIEFLKV